MPEIRMKRTMRVIALLLTLLMVCSVGSMVASAESAVTSFSDVTNMYWGYSTIMKMTQMGLFKGMTTPVNGVSEFWPERTMSRAEFITVSVRAMYPNEAKKITNQAGEWWKGYYELALEKRIVFSNELDNGALNTPMTRQEMAMVMVRCVENNGETVSNPISTSRIADYATIQSYYKSYVQKCFSLGLICGIDDIGTFAPTMSLTRAQAATVLCRLVDKSARVNVNGTEEELELPWENGGKQPKDYTWEEFEALTPAQQVAFQNTFESFEDFEAWMEKAQMLSVDKPWENGGKQPKDYTWAEFEALTPAQQIAFQNSFGSTAAFEAWMEKAQFGSTGNPWENGGKQPKDYTWAEFEALTPAQQIAFQNSFGSMEEFDKWLTKNQPQ